MTAMTVARATLATGVTLEYVERGRADGHAGDLPARRHRLVALVRADAAAPAADDPGDCRHAARARRRPAGPTPIATPTWPATSPRSGRAADPVGGARRPLDGRRWWPSASPSIIRSAPRGLVLLGALPTIKGHPDVQALWDGALATLTDPVDPALVREFQESTVAPADCAGAARHLRRREPQGAGPGVAGDVPRVPRHRLLGRPRPHHRADAGRDRAGKDSFSRRQERDALAAGIRGAIVGLSGAGARDALGRAGARCRRRRAASCAGLPAATSTDRAQPPAGQDT